MDQNGAANQEISGILNSISDGILIIDKDFNIVFANKAVLHLCGAADEGVTGKKCHDISHRCPTPCAVPEKCPHGEVFSTGRPTKVKHVHYCHDGDARVFSISASPVMGPDGQVIRMIEVLRDITAQEKTAEALKNALSELVTAGAELKKSEAFMRNILESIDEGFIIIDPEYRIVSANKSYCRQVKCNVENVTGKHCYEVSHHLEKPCFWSGEDCAPSRTFRTGAPSLAIHTHYDSEGKPLYIETRSYPITDESGKVTAVIETLNNITEIRRLEEQLRHSQKMEAIGTLAGGIAHDFNNLLSVIIGYVEIIKPQIKDDEALSNQLRLVLDAANRAALLTRGLLAFSRKQVMELKPVMINALIGNFRKMLERIIGEDIELGFMLSDEEMTVKADTGQIEQVIMNLAANGRDAMPHGGVLAIRTGLVTMDSRFINTRGFGEPGEYAVIDVADTGTGMEEDVRQRIFEPYFTTKEIGRGTGLGLSVAFGIIKQHTGYLECRSKPGKGTSFHIYLPIAAREDESAETDEITSPARGAETILVAEDDPVVRKLLTHILSNYGYGVIDAVDGEDAVRKFRDNKDRINLLLFDVLMPVKNGKEAYQDIRGMNPEIKAIFVSGYARDLIHDNGAIEKGPEFIQKPVAPKELLKKIREVLDR